MSVKSLVNYELANCVSSSIETPLINPMVATRILSPQNTKTDARKVCDLHKIEFVIL